MLMIRIGDFWVLERYGKIGERKAVLLDLLL